MLRCASLFGGSLLSMPLPKAGRCAEQAGLQEKLEGASVGRLALEGLLFVAVLAGRDLIIFASLSQNLFLKKSIRNNFETQ